MLKKGQIYEKALSFTFLTFLSLLIQENALASVGLCPYHTPPASDCQLLFQKVFLYGVAGPCDIQGG